MRKINETRAKSFVPDISYENITTEKTTVAILLSLKRTVTMPPTFKYHEEKEKFVNLRAGNDEIGTDTGFKI